MDLAATTHSTDRSGADASARCGRCGRLARRGDSPWHGADEHYFQQTVRPHLDLTLRTARRLMGCADLAWDATQETLLTLWNTPEQPANLSAWLVRTVRHRSLQLMRSRSRRRTHEQQAAWRRPEHSLREEPCEACQRRELQARIDALLARLPWEQREVFRLCEVEDMDYRAAALLLDVPIGTVRSRLHRVRLLLQNALRDERPCALAGDER